MPFPLPGAVARAWQMDPDRVTAEPVGGGLESSVLRLSILDRDNRDERPRRVIVKELEGCAAREARIYGLLWTHLPRPPLAALHGRADVGRRTYLCLEDVSCPTAWPWSDVRHAARVCAELGRFHTAHTIPRRPFRWDYDRRLRESAASTLALALEARDERGRRYWRRIGDLRRLVATLAAVRARLLVGKTVVIHGDLHPGNVLLRGGSEPPEVVLIDWARARLGSPLEDLSSWLHALGCWEPEARRLHDTLFRAYLQATRWPGPITPALRTAYWWAAASNGLAGAIRYHLAVLGDRSSSADLRHHASLALASWQRVVRRAATDLPVRGTTMRATGPGDIRGTASGRMHAPDRLLPGP